MFIELRLNTLKTPVAMLSFSFNNHMYFKTFILSKLFIIALPLVVQVQFPVGAFFINMNKYTSHFWRSNLLVTFPWLSFLRGNLDLSSIPKGLVYSVQNSRLEVTVSKHFNYVIPASSPFHGF